MEEKYLIATLFTNFNQLYTVQPGNTDFHKSQSQCTLKVISQSWKVSKYFKPKKHQSQNLLNQLDLVGLVPNIVISSRGIAGLWSAEQGTLKIESTEEEFWRGEAIKCLVREVCVNSSCKHFWHSLKSISLSLVIKVFATPSPPLTTSTKFLGEKVMREWKQLYNQKGSAVG